MTNLNLKKGTKVVFYVARYRKWIKGYFMKPAENEENYSIILSDIWLKQFEPDAFEQDYGDWKVDNNLIKVKAW